MIGDLVLITPAIRAIKKNYPSSTITLMVKNYTKELLTGHPDVSEIIIDKNIEGEIRSILDLINYFLMLRKKKFDIGITYLNKPFYAMMMCFAGIPYRIGDKSKILHGFLYNFGVFQHWRDYTKHEIEQNMDLITPLGINELNPQVTINVNYDAQQKIKDLLSKEYINDNDYIIGIHPGTGGGNKPYLPEDFAQAINLINKQIPKAKIIITGGKNEEAAAEKIYSLCTKKPILFVNRTSLPEFISLINKFNLYIGVDTGPFHVAAGFGIPIVAIFTTKAVKPSWNTRNIILRNPYSCKLQCFPRKCDFSVCQKAIKPEDIANAANDLYHGKGNSSIAESQADWIKKSINILFIGKETEELACILSKYGCNSIQINDKISIRSLIKAYKKEDINIVCSLSKRHKLKIWISYIFSIITLEIHILIIDRIDRRIKDPKELLQLFINSFRKSIL